MYVAGQYDDLLHVVLNGYTSPPLNAAPRRASAVVTDTSTPTPDEQPSLPPPSPAARPEEDAALSGLSQPLLARLAAVFAAQRRDGGEEQHDTARSGSFAAGGEELKASASGVAALWQRSPPSSPDRRLVDPMRYHSIFPAQPPPPSSSSAHTGYDDDAVATLPTTTEECVASSPFTNDEPLAWCVPPGAAEATVAEHLLHWSIGAGGHFTSVVSSASVVRGKWMYEVTLCTDGLLQIGWCGPLMMYPWTPRLGVGDFPFTIGFDGHRQQVWNVRATPAGHRWTQGDVIGCCFDLESGIVSYYQNGQLIDRKPMLTWMTTTQECTALEGALRSPSSPAGGGVATTTTGEDEYCFGSGSFAGVTGGDITTGVAGAATVAPPATHHRTSSPPSCGSGIDPSRFGRTATASLPSAAAAAAATRGWSSSSPVDDVVASWSLPVPPTDFTLSYSPAISLGQYESCMVNLGAAPFRYPVAGYRAIDHHGARHLHLWLPRAALLTSPALRPNLSTVLLAAVRQLRTPDDASHHTRAWSCFSLMIYHAAVHAVTAQSPATAAAPDGGIVEEVLHLLSLVLTDDEASFVMAWVASYASWNASVRRLDKANTSTWTPSADLLLLRFCVSTSEAFRDAWVRSPNFFTDMLNVFRVKTPNNFDLETILFPSLPTSSDVPPSSASASTSFFANNESTFADAAPGDRAAPSAFAREALNDHEERSAALHDCVLAVDDNRRLAIVSALLDAPATRNATCQVVRDVVVELRKQLARPPTQSAALTSPNRHRPRVSDACVDSPLASKIFFALVCYLSQRAERVVDDVRRRKEPFPDSPPTPPCVGSQISTTTTTTTTSSTTPLSQRSTTDTTTSTRGGGGISDTAAKLQQQQRIALRDVFCPRSALLCPTIEGVDFSRLGGSFASVMRSGAIPPLSAAEIAATSRPNHQHNSHSSALPSQGDDVLAALMANTMILYSASVKELVMATCGDMLLRHRQKEAWALAFATPASSPSSSALGGGTGKSNNNGGNDDGPSSRPCSPNLASVCAPYVSAGETWSAESRARLVDDLYFTGRSCAWAMATLFQAHCHERTAEFCNLLVQILDGYEPHAEFLLIPVVYAECFVDVWHFARKTASHYPQLVRKYPDITRFFVARLLDTRLAHAETAEYLMLSCAGVIDSIEPHRQAVVSVLEKHPDELHAALHRLLTQFQHPLGWTLAVPILAKLNAGNGFCWIDVEDESLEWNMAFPTRRQYGGGGGGALGGTSATPTPPTGSSASSWCRSVEATASDLHGSVASAGFDEPPAAFRFYRRFMATRFLADSQTAQTFFKLLMTHCNWAISELGVSLSAVNATSTSLSDPTAASASAASDVISIRRRCAAVFELTRRLLSILEFLVDCGKDVYFRLGGPGCGSVAQRQQNIALLLEVWTQAVSRFCTRNNTLREVVGKRVPIVIEKLQPWKLMAPLVGILYHMLDGGANMDLRSNVFLQALIETKRFSWSVDAVEHLLLDCDWPRRNQYAPWERSRVFLSPDLGVLEHLQSWYAQSGQQSALRLHEDDDGRAEEGICFICMTNEINTVFVPCEHSSCIDCIDRQMQNTGKCFYCNAPVTGLRPLPDLRKNSE